MPTSFLLVSIGISKSSQNITPISTGNLNIAERLPENSRNTFVDLQSKESKKKTDQKNSPFH